MGKQVRTRLTPLLPLLAAVLLSVAARPVKDGGDDNLVRLMKARYIEQLEINGQQCRKAIESTFLHNGTYLISDSALWNVDTRIINCVGHVKVIQDETILTSDKLDYLIDEDLAQFKGTLVQLQNKKKNILRTRNLDYNTRDSIALFSGGASMRDENGQLIESQSGSYSSASKLFTFEDNVNMFTDSVFIQTSRLIYNSDQERADFPNAINFWKGKNMLSARTGWYNRGRETFFFQDWVHGLTNAQEFWSDTLYFYRNTNDMLLLGHAQVQDTTRDAAAMAHYIHYEDSIRQVTLKRDAAVVLFTEEGDGEDVKRDTIYIGGDLLSYRQYRYCDIPKGTLEASKTRLNDILTDAVTEFRRKAAEAAAAARAEQENQLKQGLNPPARKNVGNDGAGNEPPAITPAGGQTPPAEAPEPPAADTDTLATPVDSLAAPADSLMVKADSLAAPSDSLAVPADTLAAPEEASEDAPALVDSLAAPADSLALQKDSIALPPEPLDTTRYGFAVARGKVKIFRRDIQVRCDSMVYNDLDSTACFYLDPVVWNEGNRQYTADSLFTLIGGRGVRKASLQSNAFIVTQDAPDIFDQIKGAEIMAYFDSTKNTLQRFDALGGTSALFFLEENEVIATVNKVEAKMLSALLKDGTLDQVFYFEQPHNNAYPIVQLPESEKRMKGFSWREDERPARPEDITPLKLRNSERKRFYAISQPRFEHSRRYFPGYIDGIRREIAIRDSLARIPRPKRPVPLPDPVADSLFVQADSLAAKADSLVVDVLAQVDSLTARADSLTTAAAAADSLATVASEVDPLSVPTVDPKQKRAEERETRRKMRIAAQAARDAERERRWAQLDSLDAAKAAAKAQKKLEKERARKLRLLKAQERRRQKEEAKLQKYIEKYRKEYERKQQKSKPSGERPQAVEPGREIPAPPEPGKKALGSDPVLRDDGSPDDDPVLGGGSVPGA